MRCPLLAKTASVPLLIAASIAASHAHAENANSLCSITDTAYEAYDLRNIDRRNSEEWSRIISMIDRKWSYSKVNRHYIKHEGRPALSYLLRGCIYDPVSLIRSMGYRETGQNPIFALHKSNPVLFAAVNSNCKRLSDHGVPEHVPHILLMNNLFTPGVYDDWLALTDDRNRTFLHKLARSGKTHVLEWLLDCSEGVFDGDAHKVSVINEQRLLQGAIEQGQLETVKWALRSEANANGYDDRKKDRLLFPTIKEDNPEVLVALLENNANPTMRGGGGTNAYMYSARLGSLVMLSTLLAYSKDENISEHLNVPDDHGDTPLHYAMKSSESSVVERIKLLIASGANVNAVNEGGRTPLHYADTKEAAAVLLASGADAIAQDDKGDTVLHKAAKRGEVALARLVVQHLRAITEDDETLYSDLIDILNHDRLSATAVANRGWKRPNPFYKLLPMACPSLFAVETSRDVSYCEEARRGGGFRKLAAKKVKRGREFIPVRSDRMKKWYKAKFWPNTAMAYIWDMYVRKSELDKVNAELDSQRLVALRGRVAEVFRILKYYDGTDPWKEYLKEVQQEQRDIERDKLSLESLRLSVEQAREAVRAASKSRETPNARPSARDETTRTCVSACNAVGGKACKDFYYHRSRGKSEHICNERRAQCLQGC